MRRLPLIAVTLALAAGVAPGATAVVAEPVLVSVGADATPTRGAAVSADGRFVAFTSTATLTGVPTGGARQLYVRDLVDARTLLASRTSAGAAANADVDDPLDRVGYAISGDGRYVVFASAATNLAPLDVDGTDLDVFRTDLSTGAIQLVSTASGGGPANGPVAGDPDVSYDGSRVVFDTGFATNMWPGDASNASDILMRDLVSGEREPVNVAANGAVLTGPVGAASISADGRVVVFEHDGDIVARNVAARTTTSVSLAAGAPDVSGDGRFVAFERPVGTTVLRRDQVTGVELPVVGPGRRPQISADGQRVVFESDQSLGAGDGNGVADVYARRVGAGSERVSQRLDGTEVDRAATLPALSANGARIVFDMDDGAPSQSLVPGDADGAADTMAASLAPTDLTGPQIGLTAPAGGTVGSGATIDVIGAATDSAGVVAVSVNGFPARLGDGGAFGISVPLAVGVSTLAIRAVDGSGNDSERFVEVTRAGSVAPPAPSLVRARALKVVRVGRRTEVRFTLAPGAQRVVVRLWRRVPRDGQSPTWRPLGLPRGVSTAPGARRAVVSPGPLRPDFYQVRVTVVSAGGVAVSAIRHRVRAVP